MLPVTLAVLLMRVRLRRYPVYPPMRLQVWVGASPYSMQPASPWHDVQASDALQTFALWPHAPVGR